MKLLRILVCGLVFLTSCRAMNGNNDDINLEDTRWQLIAMDKKPADLGENAFIIFNDKDRKITGKAMCNSFFADYELLRNKITFSPIGSTKMFCDGVMDKENQIITNLQKVQRYEIKYGLLYLYGDDLLLTYKKTTPVPTTK